MIQFTYVLFSKCHVHPEKHVLLDYRIVASLESVLKGPGCKKIPSRIETVDDAINVATSLSRNLIVPIFRVSAVSHCQLFGMFQFSIRSVCV